MNLNTEEMKLDNGRTITTVDGKPVLTALTMRPSTTAHGRVKAMLVIPVSQGERTGVAVLPFAQGVLDGTGWTPEFRLEMN